MAWSLKQQAHLAYWNLAGPQLAFQSLSLRTYYQWQVLAPFQWSQCPSLSLVQCF